MIFHKMPINQEKIYIRKDWKHFSKIRVLGK